MESDHGMHEKSEGCRHCYAEVMARRLHAMGTKGYENGFKLTLQPHRLEEPLKIKTNDVFCKFNERPFHEKVPFEYIDRVFDIIKSTPQHKYQVLTKRAEQMERYFQDRQVPQNVWLGVTVENKSSIFRIDYLRRIKNVSVKFLSVEPLLEDLGFVDFQKLTGLLLAVKAVL